MASGFTVFMCFGAHIEITFNYKWYSVHSFFKLSFDKISHKLITEFIRNSNFGRKRTIESLISWNHILIKNNVFVNIWNSIPDKYVHSLVIWAKIETLINYRAIDRSKCVQNLFGTGLPNVMCDPIIYLQR